LLFIKNKYINNTQPEFDRHIFLLPAQQHACLRGRIKILIKILIFHTIEI